MAEKEAAPFSQTVNSAGNEQSSVKTNIGRMIGALDEIERRIESLREHASALEQEKDDLLCALQMLADNRELLTMNRCKFSWEMRGFWNDTLIVSIVFIVLT